MAIEPIEIRGGIARCRIDGLYKLFTDQDVKEFWEVVKHINLNDPMPPWDNIFTLCKRQTLDDLDKIPDDQKYLWSGRIIRRHLNLLVANPYVGKTTLLLELQRRLWHGIPMPCSNELIYPKKTPSLWILGDNNADEIGDRAREFGIPGKAIHLCASPGNPRRSLTLDSEDILNTVEYLTQEENYGFVAVDSAIRATYKRMWDSSEADDIWKPLINIIQDVNTTLIATLHSSKEGEPLGRRLDGIARSTNKMYRVGKDTPESVKRRLTTVTNRTRSLDDLVLTIHGDRIEFNDDSVQEPDVVPRKQGRPSIARDEAKEYIRNFVSTGPEPWGDIRSAWRGDRMTLVRARQDLEKNHEIRVTGPEDGDRAIIHGCM
jgi:hypothetical protein